MAYVTAITDRDQADILAQNSKAFWNAADWVRIDGNSLETNTALLNALGIAIDFDALSTPNDVDIQTITEVNALLINIENMRLWVATYAPIADDDFVEIKDDWLEGQSAPSPYQFLIINSWEKVLDLIFQIYKAPYSVESPPITGVAVTGAENLGYE